MAEVGEGHARSPSSFWDERIRRDPMAPPTSGTRYQGGVGQPPGKLIVFRSIPLS